MWSESLSCDKNLTGFQLALKSLVFVKFSLSFEHFYEFRKWLAVLSVSCSSHAASRYSMDQAICVVMDNQSPKILHSVILKLMYG